ncbi:phage tail assembly chaperone [Pseudomonas sp. PDM20]|uniref:phage tail assembly chaperone n=1 Tax=Pseudomonas sp. PDM20 TaxID=2769254 RepID=UPI00177FCF9B|nr:phage tail assembly chaperone [Pseudomonas sp. PDM20]MBD9685259.1 hypothetical protein [Pseudomonas sp. PDM20]
MTRFTIEQNPTFVGSVEIPRVGAQGITVAFTFKYRDRASLAQLYSGWAKRQQALAEHLDTDDLVAVTESMLALQVEQLEAIIADWEFAEPCTAENIRRLVESSVSAPERILSAYTQAYAQARQGN